MKVVHRLLLVGLAWWLQQGGAPTVAEGCQHACGGVPVHFPFGLEPACAMSKEFVLDCKNINGSRARLQQGNIPIRKISTRDSTMVVSLPELRECYNDSGRSANKSDHLFIDLSSTPQYRFSDSRNNLTVLGCDTYALISDKDGMFRSGCIAYCSESIDFTKETTCSGLGCCQASIPKGLQKLRIKIDSVGGHVSVAQFNPCGLAFVVDRRSFNISNRTLPGYKDLPKTADVVLDWMVGWNSTCQQAQLNQSSYACGNNTDCRDFENGSGYRCFCKDGYDGNPYDRTHGCQDIDECEDPEKYQCHGKCHNLPGSHTCENDPPNHRPNRPGVAVAAVLAPVFFIGVGASASSTWKWRIRRINFKRNGGEHLKSAGVRIFKEAELAKATDNFNDTKKLGEDGFGSVYRVRLKEEDADVVIKKPKDVHKPQVKRDFKHELTNVMQKSHRYVVKLRGICLETRIPTLVYDYIPNGTLFQHIHPKVSIILESWKSRLKIAGEAALALKYMHSCNIIHGNIKSANILLDQNWSVKVSDFGTSVLISPEHSHIAANGIEGRLGYIDPEYLTNGKLTMKSDVYSFGVVLVELLTGKKPTSPVTTSAKPVNSVTDSREPISSVTDSGEPTSPTMESGEPTSPTIESGEPTSPISESEEQIDIISYFVSSEKDKTLDKILPSVIDFKASSDDEMDEVKKVAAIAVKCLHKSSRKRPAMEKVAQDLAKIDPSLIDEGENNGITIEVHPQMSISFKLDEAFQQGMSSCLSSMGMN